MALRLGGITSLQSGVTGHVYYIYFTASSFKDVFQWYKMSELFKMSSTSVLFSTDKQCYVPVTLSLRMPVQMKNGDVKTSQITFT